MECGYLYPGSSIPSAETDTHEFTDNKYHICLNIGCLKTEGESPHFANKIQKGEHIGQEVDEIVKCPLIMLL